MYQAVFVDIDKTLLDRHGKVTKETDRAIKKANEKGIRIFLVSGRSRASALKFKKFSSGYMISSNGADIYDFERQKVFYQMAVEPEVCEILYEIANQRDLIIKFDFGKSRAGNKVDYLEDYEVEIPDDLQFFLKENKVVQVAICCEDLQKIEDLKEYVGKHTRYSVTNQFIWEVNGKCMQAIHITNPTVSKGNAMKELCAHLGIDLKKTVAIGDKGNDISMMKLAGFSVAMGNAMPNVKEAADFVTKTNHENGVAYVLEKIIEN